MSTSYLSKLERDEFVPKPPNLDRIIAALEVLEVEDADSLRDEYEAVKRERELLDQIEQGLRSLDEPEQRQRLLERLRDELAALADQGDD